MAQNESSLTQYKKEFIFYQSLKRQLKELLEKVSQSKQDEDYIRYQLKQLSEAKLTEGEQDELEKELATLSHTEEIKGALYKIAELLNGEEQGSVPLLKEALLASDALDKYYPKAKEITERLRAAYIDLNDLASEAGSQKEDIEFSPERLQWVNERLDMLYSLEQKHRVSTVEGLITLRDTYERQLAAIDSFDEQINELTTRTEASYRELKKLASQLHAKRKKVSEGIAKELMNKLSLLGMPNTRFRIDFIEKPEPESDGADDVRFMFSANKSGALERVAQTASGGEISRLMLCIKAMIAGFTALPAIIFDEVDMGVSGDIADKMGLIMLELGGKMQVIAITHLPQIASKGKEHYYVYKQDTDEHTVTQIKKLTNEERITEVARMLSGATLTNAAMANARELLNL
jgi:DNA repair protein RecN (Recombination protein N)